LTSRITFAGSTSTFLIEGKKDNIDEILKNNKKRRKCYMMKNKDEK